MSKIHRFHLVVIFLFSAGCMKRSQPSPEIAPTTNPETAEFSGGLNLSGKDSILAKILTGSDEDFTRLMTEVYTKKGGKLPIDPKKTALLGSFSMDKTVPRQILEGELVKLRQLMGYGARHKGDFKISPAYYEIDEWGQDLPERLSLEGLKNYRTWLKAEIRNRSKQIAKNIAGTFNIPGKVSNDRIWRQYFEAFSKRMQNPDFLGKMVQSGAFLDDNEATVRAFKFFFDDSPSFQKYMQRVLPTLGEGVWYRRSLMKALQSSSFEATPKDVAEISELFKTKNITLEGLSRGSVAETFKVTFVDTGKSVVIKRSRYELGELEALVDREIRNTPDLFFPYKQGGYTTLERTQIKKERIARLKDELDLNFERNQTNTFRKHFSNNGIEIETAKVSDLESEILDSAGKKSKYMILDFVEGKALSEHLNYNHKNAGLRKAGETVDDASDDIVKKSSNLFDEWYRYLYTPRTVPKEIVFHSDTHLGNIMYSEKNPKAVLIDFGKVSAITPEDQKKLIGVEEHLQDFRSSITKKEAVIDEMIEYFHVSGSLDRTDVSKQTLLKNFLMNNEPGYIRTNMRDFLDRNIISLGFHSYGLRAEQFSSGGKTFTGTGDAGVEKFKQLYNNLPDLGAHQTELANKISKTLFPNDPQMANKLVESLKQVPPLEYRVRKVTSGGNKHGFKNIYAPPRFKSAISDFLMQQSQNRGIVSQGVLDAMDAMKVMEGNGLFHYEYKYDKKFYANQSFQPLEIPELKPKIEMKSKVRTVNIDINEKVKSPDLQPDTKASVMEDTIPERIDNEFQGRGMDGEIQNGKGGKGLLLGISVIGLAAAGYGFYVYRDELKEKLGIESLKLASGLSGSCTVSGDDVDLCLNYESFDENARDSLVSSCRSFDRSAWTDKTCDPNILTDSCMIGSGHIDEQIQFYYRDKHLLSPEKFCEELKQTLIEREIITPF